MTIHSAVVTEPSSEQSLLLETTKEIERARREGYTEIEWDEVERRPPFIVLGDGSLWRREPGEPVGGRNRRDYRYALTTPLEGPALGIAWYRRTAAPEPESVAELDERERRNQKAAAAQQAESKRQREALRKSPPARALTMGDAYRPLGKASLRELARRLEAAGGVLVVEKDGGLTIRVLVVDDNVVRLGQALNAASVTILALAKRKPGPVDPESLPDAELTLGGDLLPVGLLGHGEVEKR